MCARSSLHQFEFIANNSSIQLIVLLFFVVVSISSSHGHDADEDDVIEDDDCGGSEESTEKRPCKFDDLDCIRKYLASNSDCEIAKEKAVDTFELPRLYSAVPSANMSIILQNIQISGLKSAKIVELYENTKSGQVVLAVKIKKYNVQSSGFYATFQRKAKESITISDTINVDIPSVTITAIISKVPDLRLEEAKIHAYLDKRGVDICLGDKFIDNDDPYVKISLSKFIECGELVALEVLMVEAPIVMRYLIQKRLCNYGMLNQQLLL